MGPGLVLLSWATTALAATFHSQAAVNYLYRFGHITAANNIIQEEKNSRNKRSTTVTIALKHFQELGGLGITGKLDKETKDLMTAPRCGGVVRENGDLDSSDFVLSGGKWEKKELTYHIAKYPSGGRLSNQEIDEQTHKAFEMWAKQSGLSFRVVGADERPMLDIRFEGGDHGDGTPFDGPGGVLAHAFFPGTGKDGKAHFDDSEDWSVTFGEGTQILNTLTHEIGHNLGLRHSYNRGAIMTPFYKGWDQDLKLSYDDIRGIQELYGEPIEKPKPVKPEKPKPTTISTKPGTIEPFHDDGTVCSRIDTIIQSTKQNTFVFRGDIYYKLNDVGVEGGPRKISDGWSGLPNNLDAAFVWRKAEKIYFFKGDQYWRYSSGTGTGHKLDSDYPRNISAWPGLPHSIDAAIQWGRNSNIYFFKGSNYWKYDTKDKKMADGYPRPIKQAWKGFPDNMDGAMQWKNKTYVFKADKYYRLNDETIRVDEGFPRNAGHWWFAGACNADRNLDADRIQFGYLEAEFITFSSEDEIQTGEQLLP